jgi:ribosomal protein L9
MKPTTDSQVKQIFNYLMSGARLTGLEAIKLFGSIKCSNRISEIERDYGVTVQRTPIKIKTKFGEKRIVQYWINSNRKLSV